MLPVKSNNHQPRKTRAQSRKARNQAVSVKGEAPPKTSKSKNKKKNKSICANSQGETSSTGETTLNTGLINRKCNDGLDTKTTMKKVNFESKPIIKDIAKKIHNYSKQYTPEYFTNILEYMIEKEARKTLCPTAEKINKWRVYLDRQREIEEEVRRQFQKITNSLFTGRKRLREKQRREMRRNQYYEQGRASSLQSGFPPNSQHCPYRQSPNQNESDSSDHSSSIENVSCPDIYEPKAEKSQMVTDQSLAKQWDSRYDNFHYLIQRIFQILGQHECTNTIFPVCYLFYTMSVSDTKVFSFLKQPPAHPSQLPPTKSPSNHAPSATNLTEYYIIASILIATKYHEIYPVSLVDLIDNVNYKLDYDYAIRVEGRILEILGFGEFFSENQTRFLGMFGIVVGWGANQMNVCEFMLESGLNNPKLYAYSPMHKAAVVIAIYQQQFLSSQQKFMLIRSLCPGLSLDLTTKIKKQYTQILVYNTRHNIMTHKRRYFIFQNQLKKMSKNQ